MNCKIYLADCFFHLLFLLIVLLLHVVQIKSFINTIHWTKDSLDFLIYIWADLFFHYIFLPIVLLLFIEQRWAPGIKDINIIIIIILSFLYSTY